VEQGTAENKIANNSVLPIPSSNKTRHKNQCSANPFMEKDMTLALHKKAQPQEQIKHAWLQK
jgi:hypothetical protein